MYQDATYLVDTRSTNPPITFCDEKEAARQDICFICLVWTRRDFGSSTSNWLLHHWGFSSGKDFPQESFMYLGIWQRNCLNSILWDILRRSFESRRLLSKKVYISLKLLFLWGFSPFGYWLYIRTPWRIPRHFLSNTKTLSIPGFSPPPASASDAMTKFWYRIIMKWEMCPLTTLRVHYLWSKWFDCQP